MKQIGNLAIAICTALYMSVAWAAASSTEENGMPDAIRAAGAAAIQKHFGAQFRRLELASIGRLDGVWSTAFDRVSVSPLRATTLSPRVCVNVQTFKGETLMETAPACFTPKAFNLAWVAKYDIARGAPIRESDFELAEFDVMRTPGAVRAQSENLLGQRLRLPLKKDQALLRGALESMPKVVRNQEINLRVVSGRIAIDTRAVALVDGQYGSVIPVRLVSNNERLNATVEASGIATLRIR